MYDLAPTSLWQVLQKENIQNYVRVVVCIGDKPGNCLETEENEKPTKISQLEFSTLAEKKVLRFDIPV